MRLGFVGVGRWAQKLRAAFEAESAHATRYYRTAVRDAPGFGEYNADGWQHMIADSRIDALVLCAPPDVTTEVALACAAAGKPVMVTKPLMLEQPVPIRAPFYVDYFRLWSEAFERFRSTWKVDRLEVELAGSGPIRSFPGLLDYGPHAMAYVRSLYDNVEIKVEWANYEPTSGSGELLKAGGNIADRELRSPADLGFVIRVGNGEQQGIRRVTAPSPLKDWNVVLGETPEHMVLGDFREDKSLVLRRMCRSFMNDISEGFVTTEHLDLSCAVMRDLAEVRRLADEGAKK